LSGRKDGTRFQPRAFRRKRNLLLGVASEIANPVLRPFAKLASKHEPSEPHQWRKGLILGHNHIGDVLYRTCSLGALGAGLPDCEWSYLTSPTSAPILEDNPDIQEILPWSRSLEAWDIDSSHRDKLKAMGFDVVLCTNTLRHYPDLLLATWLGIPNRVGFTHKGLSALVTHPVPARFPSPYAGYFRSMVAEITGTIPTWPLAPQVFLTDDDRDEAARALRLAGINPDTSFLACSLTTRQKHGNWPVRSMISVLREVQKKSDFQIVLTGSNDDAAALESYASELGGGIKVLAGKLSIRGFAALLERSNAVFTLDSGPRHIANAVGASVIFARNMSHSEVEAGKYFDTETDIAPPGEYLNGAEIAVKAASTSAADIARIIVAAVRSGEARA
jgi:ADP-heptose:LPS heptosyltransferase